MSTQRKPRDQDIADRNRSQLDRQKARYANAVQRREEIEAQTPLPSQSAGYDDSGRLTTKRSGHNAIPAKGIDTNGGIADGQPVVMRGDRADAMPRVRQSSGEEFKSVSVEVAYLYQPDPLIVPLNEIQLAMFDVLIDGASQPKTPTYTPEEGAVLGGIHNPISPTQGLEKLIWEAKNLPFEIEYRQNNCIAGVGSLDIPNGLGATGYLTRVFIRSSSPIDLTVAAIIEPETNVDLLGFAQFELLALRQRYTGEVIEDDGSPTFVRSSLVKGSETVFDSPNSETLSLDAFNEPVKDNPYQNNLIIIDCTRSFPDPGFTGIGKVRIDA